jgi:hypothetical protein
MGEVVQFTPKYEGPVQLSCMECGGTLFALYDDKVVMCIYCDGIVKMETIIEDIDNDT